MRRMAKTLLAAAAVSGLVCLGTVSAYGGEASDKVLHIGWSSDISTMDVHQTTSAYAIPQSCFDRLLEVQLNEEDGTTELVNSLAKDWSVSEDGLVYSFTLRDDVKFCDGTPMMAADVEYTFTRMFALDESVQTDFTTVIKGSQALIDGETETLEGFTVIDDYNFTIELEEPFAGFAAVLATPTCSIMSKANVEEAGADFGILPEKTIGSGPYMVTEWIPNLSITLERNPYYWGEPASAAQVAIKIYPDATSLSREFQNGNIDILDCDLIDSVIVASEYKTNYADQIVTVSRVGTDYLTMNENIEPMNDVRVRKAFQMAIDRASILEVVYGGDGVLVDGIFPYGGIGFCEENQGWLQYDPEGAKALLEEAGYADGFEMELSADADEAQRLLLLQIVQQNLEEVGIKANIVTYDHSAWLSLRKSGEMGTFSAPWTLDYNDPSNIIDVFFSTVDGTKGRSLNYPDTEVMARVIAARSIVDEEERMAEYAALEKKIVQEDAAWLPLFSRQHLFVVSDTIEHFTPHWAGYSDFNYYGVTMK